MARTPVPNLAPVAVIWIDATSHPTKPVAPAPAVTFGVIVEMTKDAVKIASEAFYDGDRRDHTTVPRNMVKRIVSLTRARNGNGTLRVPEFLGVDE